MHSTIANEYLLFLGVSGLPSTGVKSAGLHSKFTRVSERALFRTAGKESGAFPDRCEGPLRNPRRGGKTVCRGSVCGSCSALHGLGWDIILIALRFPKKCLFLLSLCHSSPIRSAGTSIARQTD